MEISNETKAKVFAQYLGQKYKTDVPIVDPHTYIGELTPYVIYRAMDRVGWKWTFKLILKPLSAITDEDAIEVAKMDGYSTRPRHELIKIGRDVVWHEVGFCYGSRNAWQIGQYLQSKGYDLHNYHLDGKTLHEAGLAIYETDKTE